MGDVMRFSGLGLMALVLVGCGGTERDERLSALEAQVDAASAQQTSDLEAAQQALLLELAELRARFDGFDPADAGVLAAEIDAIDATVQTTAADLTARMETLEAQAEVLAGRVTALEEADALTAETLTTIQTDVSDNYVTAASIEGVVRVTDLQPDYEDVAALVADLLDARDRVADLEDSGADAEEVTALADALTELTEDVGGLADVDLELDARLTTVEADYASQDGLADLESSLDAISADYLTSADLDSLQSDLDIISSDYVTSGELGSLQSELDNISGDYVTSGELSSLQNDVDNISGDYVTSGELSSLQSDVDSISGDYVSDSRFTTLENDVSTISGDYIASDIFSILEGDVDTISSDYLTSDDYIDLAEQLEATESLVLLGAPQIIRLSCNGTTSTHTRLNLAVSSVPDDASAIVANLYTFSSSRDDHVNHHFGRTALSGTTWDNEPWNRNIPMSDVSITHQGDSAGNFHYGHGHGSNIIPLKSNGTFDASMCRGYSRGTHYVTIQVNGYYR